MNMRELQAQDDARMEEQVATRQTGLDAGPAASPPGPAPLRLRRSRLALNAGSAGKRFLPFFGGHLTSAQTTVIAVVGNQFPYLTSTRDHPDPRSS